MRVEYTELAKKDLAKVREYFSEVAPHKTDEILLEILNRALQLESFPMSGPEDDFLKSCGISRRSLIVGNYKIIYRIEEETIYITQVFDARQDPEKIISGETE
ncbi:MAG: type II toxin-antitoxin system RelE/ParE family toxin [Bacteroidetes bacterium]|nr:MAG: type II toxin-antitoxin system RelE/ParE family toxin [Bacteroidota bacterium]